jgi:hypothetical protein
MVKAYPITFTQLMMQSERALWRTDSQPEYYRSPVGQLLDDGAQYRVWEIKHSLLMRNVADCGRTTQQTLALRKVAVKMIHRRGLIDYIKLFSVRGETRKNLFQAFYGPMDFREAVILEHRQYILAASSGYCVEVLVDAVQDPNGFQMLERYQELYRDYYGLYAQFLRAEQDHDRELMAAMRPTMLEYRTYLDRLRATTLSQAPRRRQESSRRLAA